MATGIFAILAPLLLSIKTPTSLTGFLPYMFIAALVSAGAYLHVVRRHIAGFVIVSLAGGLLSVMGIVGATIVAVFATENWPAFVIYLPGLTAFVTVVASIVTQLKRKRGAE